MSSEGLISTSGGEPICSASSLTLTRRVDDPADFAAQFPQFLADMSGWLKEGRVKYREDVTDGLENAPRELIGLLKGENFGKKIIRVGPAPAGR